MIARTGDPRPVREAVPSDGHLFRTSLELLRMNGWSLVENLDLVMTQSFDIEEEPAAAALMRAYLRDGVPIVRIDPA